MRSRCALALLCTLFTLSCARERDEPAGAPPERADACAEIAASFGAALKKATGACATDSDCGCYNPVAADAGCGGITDRATTDALAELERRFHAEGCAWPHQCGPWACTPSCTTGRCVSAPPDGS